MSCAAAYSSKIQAGKDGAMVDAKSIMSIMMLAAAKGTVLDLEVEGDDEKEAAQALITLIENRFDEDE